MTGDELDARQVLADAQWLECAKRQGMSPRYKTLRVRRTLRDYYAKLGMIDIRDSREFLFGHPVRWTVA